MISLLTNLSRILPENTSQMTRYLKMLILESMLTGVGFLLMVPVLQAMLRDDLGMAGYWLILMSGVFVCYAVLRFWSQKHSYLVARHLASAMFDQIGYKIEQLPLGWFRHDTVSQLSTLVRGGVIDLATVPAHLMRPIINAIVTPLTILAGLYVINWRLAVIISLCAPVLWAFQYWLSVRTAQTDLGMHAANTRLTHRVIEFIQAQPVLRMMTNDNATRVSAAIDQWHSVARWQLFKIAPSFVGFVFMVQLSFTVVLIAVVMWALAGDIDAAVLIAILALFVRYVETLITAADLSGSLQVAQAAGKRATNILTHDMLPEPAYAAVPQSYDIAFEDVSFGYGSTSTISDVSFCVPQGTSVAFVGPSGGGKTTVLRLLQRFWDVDQGAIRVGGKDLRDIGTPGVAKMISPVFQDSFLFNASIAQNVMIGQPDADPAALDRAVKLARVDQICDTFPTGLDTIVGSGGVQLSLGERQRIAIARAFLKDAPIMIFDEATASLDIGNQAAITSALGEFLRLKTVVLITHKTSLACQADQIFFVEDGRIVETGTHNVLVERRGKYSDFYTDQQNTQYNSFVTTS